MERPDALLISGGTLFAFGLTLSVIVLLTIGASTQSGALWLCIGISVFLIGTGVLSVGASQLDGDKYGYLPGVVQTFGALAAVLVVTGWAYQTHSWNIFAIGGGALGGIAHEIAQSNGSIVVPKKAKSSDGAGGGTTPDVYLGSLAGILLGGIAGVIVASSTQTTGVALGLSTFMAGLALKGVAEAVSTSSRDPSKT